jgi:ParB-like chromosome segregation protein Spo0J
MQVDPRLIESITPYDKNPRVNDPGVDAVAASIREFGFRQPIVVDEQNVIIVGLTRYKAAWKLELQVHGVVAVRRQAFIGAVISGRIGSSRMLPPCRVS